MSPQTTTTKAGLRYCVISFESRATSSSSAVGPPTPFGVSAERSSLGLKGIAPDQRASVLHFKPHRLHRAPRRNTNLPNLFDAHLHRRHVKSTAVPGDRPGRDTVIRNCRPATDAGVRLRHAAATAWLRGLLSMATRSSTFRAVVSRLNGVRDGWGSLWLLGSARRVRGGRVR